MLESTQITVGYVGVEHDKNVLLMSEHNVLYIIVYHSESILITDLFWDSKSIVSTYKHVTPCPIN